MGRSVDWGEWNGFAQVVGDGTSPAPAFRMQDGNRVGSSCVRLVATAGGATLALAIATSCVSRGEYDAKVAELEQTQSQLDEAKRAGAERQRTASALEQRLREAQAGLANSAEHSERLLSELEQLNQRASELQRLAQERQGVVAELETQLARERQLLEEFAALAKAYGAETPEELRRALLELQRRVEATEAALRNAALELERERRITGKLQSLIDAGTLRVRRRAGRLVIELPGDVHFAAGSAELTTLGKDTLKQLAPVLRAEEDRLFVVEGHTDNQPIRVSGFRSNWHLGANRAEVSRDALLTGGLEANRVAIASWADLLPVCDQVDTDPCRKRNRRVEVLLLPRFE